MSENNYMTPPDILDRARQALGGSIDLDPASSCSANQIVKAGRWFGPGHPAGWTDGTAREWQADRLFLNPPGGKVSRETLQPIERGPGMSSAALWWDLLLHYHETEQVRSAVFVCFNIETIRTTQEQTGRGILDRATAVCVPRDRIRFVNTLTGLPDNSPRNASAIAYLGDRPDLFESAFHGIGSVVRLGV